MLRLLQLNIRIFIINIQYKIELNYQYNLQTTYDKSYFGYCKTIGISVLHSSATFIVGFLAQNTDLPNRQIISKFIDCRINPKNHV